MRPTTSTKRLLLALLASASATACAGEPAAEEVAAAAVTPDPRAARIASGKVLYEAHCLVCHGAGALGDGPGAAGLPVAPANIIEHFGDHAYEEIVTRVAEGIPPAMPPAPMDREGVEQVMAYVWSLVPDTMQARLRALQGLSAEDH